MKELPTNYYYSIRLQTTVPRDNEQVEAVQMFFELYLWRNKFGFADGRDTEIGGQYLRQYFFVVREDQCSSCVNELCRLIKMFQASAFPVVYKMAGDISEELDKVGKAPNFTWTWPR